MYIPDLRADDEVTVEHISVLQEHLGNLMQEIYIDNELKHIINHHFDPTKMQEDILKIFTKKAFLTMFQTEMGKGLILGAFIQKYIFGAESIDE